jgi:diguanylate cyclase (GGDEF)-like protein
MTTRKPIGELTVNEGVSVGVEATIRDVILVMDGNGLGVVVILRDQEPAGILTERDIVQILFEGIDLEETALQYASKSIVAGNVQRSVAYALDLMMENNIRRLVVKNDSGEFAGVVTQMILLKSVESDFFRTTLKVVHLKDEIKKLVFATENESITQTLEKLVGHNISAIPVLKDGEPVGIVTERDMLKLVRQGVAFKEPVKQYMSRSVVCVSYDTSLADVVQTLNEKGIKRVVVTDPEGQAVGVLTNRDLLKHIEEDYSDHLERKLAHSKEIMNLLPEMMLELVDIGTEQLIVWANDKAMGRYGSRVIDSPITSLVPPMKWADIYSTLRRNGKIEDVRFRNEEFVFEFSGFYISMDKAGMLGRIQLILRDITEEVMLATTDPLMSIYNRRHMNEYLLRETHRCARTGRGFALAIADLDNFKRINDTYGHPAGDSVLKSIAGRIMVSLREYDLVGRYGGEEFMIVTPEVEYDRAIAVFERVRADMEKHKIMVDLQEEVVVTMSIGAASFDRDGKTPNELIAKADERLYRAKAQGKNRVVSE